MYNMFKRQNRENFQMVATTNRARGTSAHIVKELMLQDFMQGSFLPGMKLQMDELAERYAVSRTPIREALILLSADGILTSADNYGFEVRAPSFDELCEMYDIRRSLECLAVEKLVTNGIPSGLLQQLRENLAVQEALDLADARRHAQQDMRFHELICDNCGSPMLSQLVRRCMVLSTIFNNVPFMPNFRNVGRRARRVQCAQHAKILAGLEAQDVKKACKAMSSHLANARRYFMQNAFR